MNQFYPWIQEHLLAIFAVGITLVLVYQYIIEKESGVKLSKRYRNSIFEAQSKIFLNATQPAQTRQEAVARAHQAAAGDRMPAQPELEL